jgi:hypothetical protein
LLSYAGVVSKCIRSGGRRAVCTEKYSTSGVFSHVRSCAIVSHFAHMSLRLIPLTGAGNGFRVGSFGAARQERLVVTHTSNPTRKILTPRPVKPDGLIGVVSPSGPVDPEYLEAGLSFYRDNGFRVITGRHVADRTGYLAGADHDRIKDLNEMISNPDVDAVVFARGGYGVMRIMDHVSMDRLIADPIPLVGMSDLTALQLALYKHIGLVTYSGPMAGRPDGQRPRRSVKAIPVVILDRAS